ncbi:MAG: SagB/ThcOx family dehydrogenase [Methanospirillum sp.]|nr:SagB/ThcOx family dehydrogenase [Methanospirillum sp.]
MSSQFNLNQPMGIGIISLLVLIGSLFLVSVSTAETTSTGSAVSGEQSIQLPEPDHDDAKSLDYALETRRSIRDFEDKALSQGDLSLLLWSGQGITNTTSGQRTAPSAMRKYPLTLYVAISDVTAIDPGVYAYRPADHSMVKYLNESGKDTVLKALGQNQVLSAPLTIVAEANYTCFQGTPMTEEEYSRFAALEAGHVFQNMLLMETSRGMAGTPFTGFNVSSVENALKTSQDHHVLYAMTAGYPKK